MGLVLTPILTSTAGTNNVQNLAQYAHNIRGSSEKVFGAQWVK